jgi:hypothetical protein
VKSCASKARSRLALLDCEADDDPTLVAGDLVALIGPGQTPLRVVGVMHLVSAVAGQQVPIGAPQLDTDEPALDRIAEERLQQGGGTLDLCHAIEPAREGVDTGQAP